MKQLGHRSDKNENVEKTMDICNGKGSGVSVAITLRLLYERDG